MSGFKEAQPRKQPTDKANGWLEVPNTPEAAEFQEAINLALGEPTDLEYRKAALEQSVAYYAGANRTEGEVLGLAAVFENYLRNGNTA